MPSVVNPTGKPRLAIVGASVRAAAQSAVCAGFDVVGADLFADTDLDGVCQITKVPGDRYPETFESWLAEQRVDAWMYAGALENYPELVDRMAEIAPLWGVSGEALRRCRDPSQYEPLLVESGVAHPMTIPAAKFRFEMGGGRTFLAKTYRHAAGAGVWRLQSEVDRLRAATADAWAQEMLEPNKPLSAIYVLGENNTSLLGATRQRTGRTGAEFAYTGSVGPLLLNNLQQETLTRLGERLSSKLGLRGLVGVDLVEFQGLLAVVEINPRYTASVEVLEKSCGGSAVAALAETIAGRNTVAQRSVERLFAKRIVFADRAAVIDKAFVDWMAAHDTADRPRRGERIEGGGPVCTVFAAGASLDEAESNAEQLAALALGKLDECHID